MLQLEISGMNQLIEANAKAVVNISDRKDLNNDIVDYLREVENKIFSSEGSYGGHARWQELDEKYAAWKARHGKSGNILELSGTLKDSLVSMTGFSIVRFEEDSIVFGTRAPFAEMHQYGRKHVPEREFLFVTSQDEAHIAGIVDDFIQNQVFGVYNYFPRKDSGIGGGAGGVSQAGQFLSQLRQSYGAGKFSGYTRGRWS